MLAISKPLNDSYGMERLPPKVIAACRATQAEIVDTQIAIDLCPLERYDLLRHLTVLQLRVAAIRAAYDRARK